MRLALFAVLLMLPGANALLIGTDAEGDSSNNIAAGQSVGALISEQRTDVLGVDITEDGKTLLVRLDLGVIPSGTSGYMYRVVMDVGGTEYFACWNVQWTANEDETENVLGCSRFTSGTQVGPDLKADGVVVENNAILWPVAMGEIGVGSVFDIDAVYAESWFRGVSTCCAGSQTSSQYLWNQADRGPDTDAWLIPVQQPAEPVPVSVQPILVMTADAVNITGNNVTFPVTVSVLNLTAPLEVSLEAMAPRQLNVTHPANLTLTPEAPNSTFEVHVRALFEGNTTQTFTLHATAGNLTSSLTFLITGDGQSVHSANIDSPSQGAPGFGLVWALAALVVLARRR